MRIGTLFEPRLPNSRYRCVIPLRALAERGHEIVWPGQDVPDGALFSCQLVHMHRQFGADMESLAASLRRAGVAVSYDNDDDLAAIPRDSPSYRQLGGLNGHRQFAATVRMARRADLLTTPSRVLAERYRESGVEQIEVIENYLPREFASQERRRHDGLVIGWIAGLEHAVDASRLELGNVLLRLLTDYRKLRVASIGHDLRLEHPRYFHLERTDFSQLLHTAAAFDIGIAPLADSRLNASRSNVKVKEYAALGIPWLASPVGPYIGLGPEQGGQLVADGDWESALRGLIEHPRMRRRLGRQARAWASGQTIDRTVTQWEDAFRGVIEQVGSRPTGASR